jgi:hypothetical protein
LSVCADPELVSRTHVPRGPVPHEPLTVLVNESTVVVVGGGVGEGLTEGEGEGEGDVVGDGDGEGDVVGEGEGEGEGVGPGVSVKSSTVETTGPEYIEIRTPAVPDTSLSEALSTPDVCQAEGVGDPRGHALALTSTAPLVSSDTDASIT